MMHTRSTLGVLGLFTLRAGVQAQVHYLEKNKRPAEGWPAEVVEIYQPIFTDSTLLFGKP